MTDTGVGGLLRDRIFAFSSADNDQIDLSGIDANSGTTEDDAFTLVGTFTGAAGQAIIEDNGGTVIVALDVNGDGVRDGEIFVQVAGLNADDLVL